MELFRKNKSKYYWYDFKVRGERYRGSTKETNETRAQKASALKLAAIIRGSDPLDKKPPTLREYSKGFLQWMEAARTCVESDSVIGSKEQARTCSFVGAQFRSRV